MNRFKKFLPLTAVLLFSLFAAVSVCPVHATGPGQEKCPVLGGPVNRNVYVDHEGKRIYFCCPPCIKEFEKDPEKYLEKLEKEGMVLEEAPAAGKE